ncbi:MFS transporter [Yimella sp. cx-51]|uniref:MFS transporter n=1 Tax=Yimella sp. cx-51 TaxID=2770551 RepID=UPI00165DEF4E|nr:MFS transporter [Yimella sp. cx-51]MBC9958358.1 hypothetical protein [Yimella sp. cx-51]QTH39741.1 hypothetical protein J5M86_15300 [Yimella sp. cx-51]
MKLPFLAAFGGDRLADAMWDVALVWIAVRSGSPQAAALIMICGVVPQIAVALIGGAVGDRLGLYRTASATFLARGITLGLFAGLLMASATPPVAAIAVIAALIGLIDAFHMPAVHGIPGLLDVVQEQIQGAMQATRNVASIVAAPLIAVLLGWSVSWSVGVCAFLAGLSALLLMRTKREVERNADASGGPDGSVWALAAEGVKYVAHNARLRLLLVIFAAANLFSTSPMMLGIGLKASELGWSALTYGSVFAAVAVGGVIGSLVLSKWGDKVTDPVSTGLVTLVGTGGCIALLSVASTAPLAAAAGFAAGLVSAPGIGLLVSEVRRQAGPQMMGRVMSALQLATFSCIPLGHLAFGLLTRTNSVGLAGSVMGAALIMVAGLGLFSHRRNVERAIS